MFESLNKMVKLGSEFILPTEEQLNRWSFPVSLNRSTNKLSVTQDIVNVVKADAFVYDTVMNSDTEIQKYLYRVKTADSIDTKFKRHSDYKFQSLFNDILGIRIKVPNNFNLYPDYCRVVDMSNGKSNDDGYRGIHLYYRLDNNHYTIEIQLWKEQDYDFNLWSHMYLYKTVPNEILRSIRDKYDLGLIKTKEQFRDEVDKYV